MSEGLLDCFEPNLKGADGKPTYCETSGVVIHGDTLIMASDKPVPGSSSVFQFKHRAGIADSGSRTHWMVPVLLAAQKIEDMALTPDGKYVMAITAFDRWHEDHGELDGYNTLLVWPVGQPAMAKVVQPQTRGQHTSSLPLRRQLQKHLGQPYFKIEGLAVLPGRLLLGVRELGASHEHFDYKFLVLEVSYSMDGDGAVQVGSNLRSVIDFSPQAVDGLASGLGVSGLAFSADSGVLFLLTSHENDGRNGGYLWCMPSSDLGNGRMPRIVRHESGRPLHFRNKAEGVAPIGRDTLLIVHDDDRVLRGSAERLPHQAAYSKVRLGGTGCTDPVP